MKILRVVNNIITAIIVLLLALIFCTIKDFSSGCIDLVDFILFELVYAVMAFLLAYIQEAITDEL